MSAAPLSAALIAQRALTVLSASLLVLAVALAMLTPVSTTLEGALAAMNPGLPDQLRQAAIGIIGEGTWHALMMPLMIRPIWLVPVSLGVICGGGAISVGMPPSGRTKHRQS